MSLRNTESGSGRSFYLQCARPVLSKEKMTDLKREGTVWKQ